MHKKSQFLVHTFDPLFATVLGAGSIEYKGKKLIRLDHILFEEGDRFKIQKRLRMANAIVVTTVIPTKISTTSYLQSKKLSDKLLADKVIIALLVFVSS